MPATLTTWNGKPAVEIEGADGEVFTYTFKAVRRPAGGWVVGLSKIEDGDVAANYRLVLYPDGNGTCSCPDFTFRGFRKRGETECKHLRQAMELTQILEAMG